MARWCVSMAVVLLLVGSSSTTDFDSVDESHELLDTNEEPSRTSAYEPVTRTTEAAPLQCYSCSSRTLSPSHSCITPNINSTNTITCIKGQSKCFMETIAKASANETLQRGCRDNCTSGIFTKCCEGNLCNDQTFHNTSVNVGLFRRFMTPPAALSKSDKPLPQTVLFFVTVLLLLQTVVKVAIV